MTRRVIVRFTMMGRAGPSAATDAAPGLGWTPRTTAGEANVAIPATHAHARSARLESLRLTARGSLIVATVVFGVRAAEAVLEPAFVLGLDLVLRFVLAHEFPVVVAPCRRGLFEH